METSRCLSVESECSFMEDWDLLKEANPFDIRLKLLGMKAFRIEKIKGVKNDNGCNN
jgi:hypothetical protein